MTHLIDRVARLVRVRAELIKQLGIQEPVTQTDPDLSMQTEQALAIYVLAVTMDEANDLAMEALNDS